uniref:Acetyl-CoA carboxylase n=1 Tax=Pseudo-nitzschia australis TaxID=44445 RepID=A0A7S4ATP2_9STRA|mmetsp:Transcript_19035/g.39890  ORF Transcript_19035/g.39890 Transcript_19035/m.39890 type:complete len:2082 (+) Transcript_19035:73-6318(+)
MMFQRGYASAVLAAVAASLAYTSAFNVQAPAAFLHNNAVAKQQQNLAFTTSTALLSTVEENTEAVDSISRSTVEDYVESRGGNLPIKKVLIANNGMAGTKAIMSMRQWAYMELGDERAIQFVAMASPEDINANAEFIRLADSYVEVPGGVNRNNYANVDLITKIAVENGVDAVWPGWGHASENPSLPTNLAKNGIKFIGPTAPVMSVLGDKIAANILAQTAKVPSIPWSGSFGGPDDGPLQAELNEQGTIPDEIFAKGTTRTVEEAIEAARRIGYENGIMIKASEGGGGKGIRFVDNEEDLANAYIQVSNEVVGSPIFVMQLCKNARHLEVQIVGDEHGNAVALSGRDCSTQRRFQKIFEEGPPSIAKPDTFKEMQRAAQRLTQSIGYVGAGTVEYLYNAATDDFFFLELNPRLQVEHPVTEGISNVNMPATQLQVAMGIPLYNIPEVRRFFGRDMYDTDKIDFMEEWYKDVDTHVIAARITAENPDEGFKPTSGTLERIKFQSTPSVWGYFSVGPNGGIHEYADSQFGHLFAKGANREQARKNLILALKEIEVRGEIRTTVEYLVQLLETDAFIDNTIDTAWLDGIIKEKSVGVEMPDHLTVTSAAIFKAFQHVKQTTAEVTESLTKGQVSTSGIPEINSFSTEVAYKDIRYPFDVERLSGDVYRLTVAGQTIETRVTETKEGALLAVFGGEIHRIFGMEEPLGLRLVLDGVTILMPTIFDPSEMRTDVTGKVVRYLQDNGGEVNEGEAFVEVEAMKMIMPLKATESGKITHTVSPGTVISAGDLLASLELKDPSKVKKISVFDGDLEIESSDLEESSKDAVSNILAGYTGEPEEAVQKAFADIADAEEASTYATAILNEFTRVENMFDSKLKDDVVRDMAKANAETLDVVIAENQAHMSTSTRNRVVLSTLRQVDLFEARFNTAEISDELEAAMEQITVLKERKYGELVLAADSILRSSKISPFADRVGELKATLLDANTDLAKLSKSSTLSAGVDLLTSLFDDSDQAIRNAAVEVYVRRVYRAHRMKEITVSEEDGKVVCDFTFQFSDVEASDAVNRNGRFFVVPNLESINDDLPQIIDNFSQSLGDKATKVGTELVNVLHIASSSGEGDVDKLEAAIMGQSDKLSKLGVRNVHIVIPNERTDPNYYTFPECEGYKENPLRRNMRPTFHHLLELSRLQENFSIDRIPAIAKNTLVYVGVEKTAKPVRGGPPQVVFLRGISNSPGIVSAKGARKMLQQGLDELERSQSNPTVNSQSSSRIFLHSLRELEGVSPVQVGENFQELIGQLKSELAPRLLKLRVDEIEVKVRIQSAGSDGESVNQSVRLVASSIGGEWLKPAIYLEEPDPVTGVSEKYCLVDPSSDDEEMCIVDSYGGSNLVQTKRAIARRVGSTYAYDFLGLMEVGLISEWQKYLKETGSEMDIPASVFSAKEFVEDGSGGIALGSRIIGSNKIGMLAWLISMKTPEYPEGRDIVLISNDVTVQSGSFGVEEDDFFFEASKYARANDIPRLYISCNAGARIGLVDELKSKINIKFVDESSPAKGFEYLYLKDEDYKALPAGTVIASEVSEGWAISDIIGTNHGIGVENLQGSGKIAGETSAAYDEIFTLSYVTGRSVGIGAYLVRLGQRVIQMKQGPIILTGFSALNKLLGRSVYNSQDQLGGPQIMHPNGVSHEIVDDDQQGVASLLNWLSFVPKKVGALAAVRESGDSADRKVQWRPTPTPYDPRLMMAGDGSELGFFDKGSFKEYLAGWGKSVVVGRARLGGMSFGAIAVETRQVEQVIPADPADPNSREAILPQAGQVLYPDSSYKTAQAINDFKKEGLPVMIFANWRGFSGGSRDMAGEILKFGAMIVDALREYEHPVYMYLPPHGELRGGSWVVVDPTINEDKMEMYADPDSRGGILEPAGISEIKFRTPDQVKMMHRLDEQLQMLDAEIESDFEDSKKETEKQINVREEALKGVYLAAATEFCDLHDKTGRMKAKGVIKDAVSWEDSRTFFFYRAKRRMYEDNFIDQIKAIDASATRASGLEVLQSLYSGDWEDNKAVGAFYEGETDKVNAKIAELKKDSIQAKMDALKAELDGM